MKILYLRGWEPIPYSATFSQLKKEGVGGTELHMLSQARIMKNLGHDVTILGASKESFYEENVYFQGTSNKENSFKLLKEKYYDVDVFFVIVVNELSKLKKLLPNSSIVEVCQTGPHFENFKIIDLFAFVGYGQLAYYSVKYKKYRNRFMILPNISILYDYYNKFKDNKKLNQVIWVGNFQKQGLRKWGKAMSLLMQEDKTLKWVLCSPKYGFTSKENLPAVLKGIQLPFERLEFKNLTGEDLAEEISRSKVFLASLGTEDGPTSYLDGHALAVPVLCADDIIGKYSNPEGTGLRCTNLDECINNLRFLLNNQTLSFEFGKLGREWINNNLTIKHQIDSIKHLLDYIRLKHQYNFPIKKTLQSDKKFSKRFYLERIEIRLANLKKKIF